MRKISAAFALLLALAAIYASPLPWRGWAQDALQAQLARRGIKAQFVLERMSPGVLMLRDLALAGLDKPIESLEIRYDAPALLGKKLRIHSLVARWQGGEISSENIAWDFLHPVATDARLLIRRVPLNALLSLLVAGKASGQGMVSGEMPLTIYPDGSVEFKTARLDAGKSGRILVAPDAIPGEGEQVGMVRDILKNFHYTQLSIGLDSGKDKKLSMLLQLSGNNPDVYNGREVKLNVHLTGDLVPLVTQTILPSADPGEWLKQEEK